MINKNVELQNDKSNYMIAVKTGISYYEDIELGIYYDKARNGFSKYGYLGLYFVSLSITLISPSSKFP